MLRLLTPFSLLILLCFAMRCFAAEDTVSLQLSNVPLTEALRLLAETSHQSMLISPAITGTVSLSLNHQSASAAFSTLLTTYDLVLDTTAGTALVLPRDAWLRKQQQQARFKEALSATEPITTRLFPIHYASATDIAAWLPQKKGTLQVDTRTNQILIQDTPTRLQQMAALIRQADIPVQQVFIETRLASVDSHFERELGLDFSTVTGRPPMPHALAGAYSLAIASLPDHTLLDVRLAALEQRGLAELISRPTLFTANRQPASIEAGEEIPYQEVSRSGGTGVAFRKAVLSLEVTPIILPKGDILLNIRIHQDKPASRLVQGVPAITTRQIHSRILAHNGQTVALGGIYENDRNTLHKSLPLLGRLPVIGPLLGEQVVEKNRRELLIFVTPWIVSSDRSAPRTLLQR